MATDNTPDSGETFTPQIDLGKKVSKADMSKIRKGFAAYHAAVEEAEQARAAVADAVAVVHSLIGPTRVRQADGSYLTPVKRVESESGATRYYMRGANAPKVELDLGA